jgi:tripartite-type tricarboxylate transporter receptor subunit TctC
MVLTRRILLAALSFSAVAGPALAQADFPNRPVKLLVPYAAGGGTDAIARLVAQGVGERLGKSMVVENNGSAGGNLAVSQAAGAAPDGYTVLMANQGPMTVNPHLFKSVKVDPLTSFDPLTLIAAAPLVVVVPKSSPFNTFKDLVDYAKVNPGKLNFGSAGNGSASHVATLLLNHVVGMQIQHLPYAGAGPALNDLVGGQTQLMVTTIPSVVGLIEGGNVKALAVTGKKPVDQLKSVPTVASLGYPDYEATAWYGFVVPKGTPKDVADKLRTAIIDTIKSDLIRSRLANEGAEPIGNEPEEFAAMMKAESARWKAVIAASGFKL